MNPAYVRVGLRYLAGYLVLKGIIPDDVAALIEEDPELSVLIGGVIAAGVEWLYAKAQKLGWRT